MLFNFTLKPIEQIPPWGELDDLSLSWFALTLGEYWIQAGESSLLEYSEHWRMEGSRYCEYQVARFYEDVTSIVPVVLEPVPQLLTSYISGPSAKSWRTKLSCWLASEPEHADSNQLWDIFYAASSWTRHRYLDTMYLQPQSNIHMWSDGDLIHIEWDNHEQLLDGVAAWSAIEGSFVLSREQFITEIWSFHYRLMEQMVARVDAVLAGALPSSIRIDLDALVDEHAQRSRGIEPIFRQSNSTDWSVVLQNIQLIERLANRD